MLKNKNNFEIINFFLLLGRELFRPPSYVKERVSITEGGNSCEQTQLMRLTKRYFGHADIVA
jgi:hypothetical protein